MNTQLKEHYLSLLGMSDPYKTYMPDGNTHFSGWNSQSPNLSLSSNSSVCLEIGSWMGDSAKTLSNIMLEDSVLICCDTFLGSHEHFMDKLTPVNEYGKPLLYERFLSNTYRHSSKIIPVMLSSSSLMEVCRRLHIKFDFIYIDGDHRTPAVYNDLCESYERLNDHGIILSDDFSWGTVQDGVNKFSNEYNIKYTIQHGQYIFRKDN